jgi:phosphoribosylformylglycinamidine synthase
MKACVIVFPGSNRERDVARALKAASGQAPALVWHGDSDLPQSDLIVLPGGFSYGDYLRSGAIAAHSPILQAVKREAARGVAVLGICNGFQILVESGLLPGSLIRNAELRFQCREVHLKVERTDTIFTRHYREGDVLRIPIAHADGNYAADPETLARVEGEGQVAFRYCGDKGGVSAATNANGSANNIAGVYDAGHRVLGLMPHPEDAVEKLHGNTDGAKFFSGLVESLA